MHVKNARRDTTEGEKNWSENKERMIRVRNG
jgi:hypothetical protein